MRKHMEACDVLLDQINVCSGLREWLPEVDIPAGFVRKVATSSAPRLLREFPGHFVPESPFDVALDLRFNEPVIDHLNKDNSGVTELDSHLQQLMDQSIVEVTTFKTESGSQILLSSDGWNEEERARGSPGPGLRDSESCQLSSGYGNQELRPGSSDVNNVVLDSKPRIEESSHVEVLGVVVPVPGDGRVSKGTGTETACVSVSPVHLTPVNFISASYYVERPSKPEPFGSANSTTRRTSFCRIEAFVIRSRSVTATPVQQHRFKKTAAESLSGDMK